MERKRYLVTERAGKYVAGIPNPGQGSSMMLTDREAKYDLMLGTLVLAKKTKAEKEAAEATEKALEEDPEGFGTVSAPASEAPAGDDAPAGTEGAGKEEGAQGAAESASEPKEKPAAKKPAEAEKKPAAKK